MSRLRGCKVCDRKYGALWEAQTCVCGAELREADPKAHVGQHKMTRRPPSKKSKRK